MVLCDQMLDSSVHKKWAEKYYGEYEFFISDIEPKCLQRSLRARLGF